jgi:hypothetical protein
MVMINCNFSSWLYYGYRNYGVFGCVSTNVALVADATNLAERKMQLSSVVDLP